MFGGTSGIKLHREASDLSRRRRARSSRTSTSRSSSRERSLTSSVTVPDSTLARSRMSLSSGAGRCRTSGSRCAYCTCASVRFPSGLSCSCSARTSRLLSGVRSSCDMFEKNSDLYFEETASCSAFSSTSRLACSTSSILALRPRCSGRPDGSPALRDPRWSCAAPPGATAAPAPGTATARAGSRSAVVASIVLSTRPMLSVSWSRKA